MTSARSRNPPNIVSSAATKVCTSESSCPPSTLDRVAAVTVAPTLNTLRYAFPPARAGAVSRRMKRPSRNEPSRLGASRKSSAEREGGVSTTMRSHVPSRSACARSWPSFSIAMYSWVPANELETDW